MGNFDAAIDCFSTAIAMEGNKADFYHNRGFAYRKKRDYELAIDDYSKAIELDDGHFKAFYNRAFCWEK
jgi:tetratricopeptide (TPR) repeat protein